MINRKYLNLISVFLLAGLLVFTACPPETNVEEPKSGTITGTITLTNVPTPKPQVFISVWGDDGKNLWTSSRSQINLDSTNNYTNISFSIPISEKDRFFPSSGRFRLHVQPADDADGSKIFSINIQDKRPHISNVNANVGSFGPYSISPITVNGIINVKYRGDPVPSVEIVVDTSDERLVGSTQLGTLAFPGNDTHPPTQAIPVPANAPFSITLPPFTIPTTLSLRVMGFDEINARLFSETRVISGAYINNITGINLELGNITIEPKNAKELIANTWTGGEITADSDSEADPTVDWYYINNVTTGTRYYFWWNDKADGDNTKKLDVDVYAYDINNKIIKLTNGIADNENDNAWGTPVYFNATAESNGRVYIRVRALNGTKDTGTYAIYYTTSSARPAGVPTLLADRVRANDEIARNAEQKERWYTFNVTAGTTYYLWWNDRGQGDGTKTLDVKVAAYYNYSSGTRIFAEVDSSWNPVTGQENPDNNRPISIKADLTGTVRLKVEPMFMTDNNANYGSFAIVYSTNSARP